MHDKPVPGKSSQMFFSPELLIWLSSSDS